MSWTLKERFNKIESLPKYRQLAKWNKYIEQKQFQFVTVKCIS